MEKKIELPSLNPFRAWILPALETEDVIEPNL